MFICPCCPASLNVISWQTVTSHLSLHRFKGEIIYPIRCSQEEACKSTFQNVKSFVLHLKNYHRYLCENGERGEIAVENLVVVDEPLINDQDGHEMELGDYNHQNDVDIDFEEGELFSEKINCLKESLRLEALNAIINMRGKINIPMKISIDVLHMLANVVEMVIRGTVDAFRSEYQNSDRIQSNSEKLMEVTTIIPSLNTEYKVRKIIEEHPKFVKPIPLPLGSREETVLVNDAGVSSVRIVSRSNNAQFISIEKTLRALLSDRNFFELVFTPHPIEDGAITSFSESQRFKNSPAFSNNQEKIILLQLYYDGVGITNPLRGASTIHNCGMFYFTILNLPPRYNASIHNIHTVAVCNSLDLKCPSALDILLERIVDEIERLSRDGMEIEINNNTVQVFVRLAQISGDSLGLHQIMGFIESFSVDYCCPMCYATRAEMQKFEEESECHLRTRGEYLNDVSKLESLPPGKNNFRGVKRDSIFNRLGYFHVIDNWINDPMHTLLEGVIPYVMGAVLYSLSDLCPKLTVESLNQQINQLFVGLIGPDRYNKPCCLSCFPQPGSEMRPGQSATQMWALFRFLPIMIADWIVPDAQEIWNLFLILQEIVDIVFAIKLTNSLVSHLKMLVKEFLSQFKTLYPTLSIRPKMHWLIHLATIMLLNGPIRTFWCMSYERMNGLFKLPSHIMKNFKDPQQTLAMRRQYSALEFVIENRFNRNFVEIGRTEMVPLEDISEADNFNDHFLNFSEKEIVVASKVTVNGTQYRNGGFVVVGFDEIGYTFGKIQFVVCDDIDNPLLFTTQYRTSDFDSRRFAYMIERSHPVKSMLVSIKNLADPIPLDKIEKGKKKLIRLKYHVVP